MSDDISMFPHFEVIKEKSKIKVPSIFMLENTETLFAFLMACGRHKCTVFFENEGLTVNPKRSAEEDFTLLWYMMISKSDEIIEKLQKYRENAEKMSWDNVMEIE